MLAINPSRNLTRETVNRRNFCNEVNPKEKSDSSDFVSIEQAIYRLRHPTQESFTHIHTAIDCLRNPSLIRRFFAGDIQFIIARVQPDQPAAFWIRDLPVYGDLVLAPMDGYSDLPFRSICRELGSALSYTEFISALDVLQGHPFVHEKLAYLEQERPVVYQLFDNDPERLLEVALRVQERRPDVIDINMGCSVRTVAGRGAGAGLLREPGKIARIFTLLSRALEVPVTGKIRLGWDDNNRNYLEVARAVEEHGGALLAVHARTRAQKYQGQADWDAIAAVKAAVRIPVIGNGDVRSPADIERMKTHTGCDAVMIGRAAAGNPWIFAHLERAQISRAQVFQLMESHLQRMLAFYGEERGLVMFRKHASQYLRPCQVESSLRHALLTAVHTQEFLHILHQILA